MPHQGESAPAKFAESLLEEELLLETESPKRRDIVSFGPFRLCPRERLLEKDGVPLNPGSRALDLLITLVERAPQVVSKKELMANVWRNLVVDEGNLRFNIGCLRKVLGDGQAGVRYITNVAGRGYCFVAPIWRPSTEPALVESSVVVEPVARLPARLSRMVGRDEAVVA